MNIQAELMVWDSIQNDVQYVQRKLENIKKLIEEINKELTETQLLKHLEDYDEEYIRNTVELIYKRMKVYHKYILKIPSEDIFCPPEKPQ
jgi:peptidoglycan hydrolase CwlO-like protein